MRQTKTKHVIRPKARKRQLRDAGTLNYSAYGGMNNGGLYNAYSGQGSGNDKGRQSFFLPTLFNSRAGLETIYNESWAAKRFIDLPIEQMFRRPRTYTNIDETIAKKYNAYLAKFKTLMHLSKAMRAGRLFGTAVFIFVTLEAPLNEPLDINLLRPGDLVNILVFDRYSVFVRNRNSDLRSTNYQLPDHYFVSPRLGSGFEVHASRVLRFDGQDSLSSDGWTVYDVNFGVSEIVPVLQSIYQETSVAAAVSQLVDEASIPVFKTQDFRDILGAQAAGSQTLDQLASTVNQFKSIYNAVYLDKDDDFERQEVDLAGVDKILFAYASRLAAAAGIPATVFLGRSPEGMNATGQSDLEINATRTQERQEADLRPMLDRIDRVMKITGGFADLDFEYEFPSLLDSSDAEQADVAVKKSQTAMSLVSSDIITTDEARGILDGDPVIGQLEPETPDFNEEIKAQRAVQVQQALQQQNSSEPESE